MITPTLGGKVNYRFQLRGLPAVESVRGTELVQQFISYVEAKVTALIPLEAKNITLYRNDEYRSREFQVTLENSELLSARSLILCTGAQPQRLYVPGERELMGRGVSYSAISHAQYFRNRKVAVVGGERAFDAVLKLAAIAGHVYYILARDRDLDEAPYIQQALSNPKIHIFREWEVQAILGEEYVTQLALTGINGEVRLLDVEGVFVERGLLPNSELVRDLFELDEAGRVVVNQRCETSVPGLFAAGDVTNVYAEQVPVAIGEGTKAALSAWSYLAMHKHLCHATAQTI
jgi:thioredoxin reductase